MRLKQGVKVTGIKPETLIGMMVAQAVCVELGYEFVVTSVREGQHSAKSKHYEGMAFDMRTKHMPPDQIPSVRALIAGRLGADYDVVIEPTHIHVEADEKG